MVPDSSVLKLYMAKQCDECDTLYKNDDAPYCDACGGHSWHVPDRTWGRLRQVVTAFLVMVFIAFVFWFAIR